MDVVYGELVAVKAILVPGISLRAFGVILRDTIVGAPIRAPYDGIQGELGWFPFWTRAGWQTIAFWIRITETEPDELTRQAMYIQRFVT